MARQLRPPNRSARCYVQPARPETSLRSLEPRWTETRFVGRYFGWAQWQRQSRKMAAGIRKATTRRPFPRRLLKRKQPDDRVFFDSRQGHATHRPFLPLGPIGPGCDQIRCWVLDRNLTVRVATGGVPLCFFPFKMIQDHYRQGLEGLSVFQHASPIGLRPIDFPRTASRFLHHRREQEEGRKARLARGMVRLTRRWSNWSLRQGAFGKPISQGR